MLVDLSIVTHIVVPFIAILCSFVIGNRSSRFVFVNRTSLLERILMDYITQSMFGGETSSIAYEGRAFELGWIDAEEIVLEYVGDVVLFFFFFFSSRRRHTRCSRDWSSDVCSSDLMPAGWSVKRPACAMIC